jgi:hypothetical protein
MAKAKRRKGEKRKAAAIGSEIWRQRGGDGEQSAWRGGQ